MHVKALSTKSLKNKKAEKWRPALFHKGYLRHQVPIRELLKNGAESRSLKRSTETKRLKNKKA
jgi:CRISPR/Cas system-associated protein endoribonuclease Cas2